MDRLRTMSVFVAVAEEAGFAAAGKRLNMSPPSVTRAVSQLEERLAARLLHRTTRQVRLTDAGERYLADCRRILSEIDEADSNAAGVHAAPRGMISVTTSVLFGRIVMAPVLLELLDRYPGLTVSTLFRDRVTSLIDEDLDIAVRIADLPDSALPAIRVGTVRHVICAAPEYLAAHGRPLTPADLAGHQIVDFVNMTPNGEWGFAENGRRTNFRPHARLRVDNADVAIAAAVNGNGLTRVLSYMIGSHLNSGTLELVLEDVTPPAVPVHVVHKEPGHTSARVRTAVNFIVENIRRGGALDR
jgi:DNA-binding transcriptional LysR family regulator